MGTRGPSADTTAVCHPGGWQPAAGLATIRQPAGEHG